MNRRQRNGDRAEAFGSCPRPRWSIDHRDGTPRRDARGITRAAPESARARVGRADIAEFAPPPDHPGYLAILCELIRVDLEYGWRRGRLDPLDGYRERFPEVFRDSRLAGEIAFEASRLRRQTDEGAPALGAGVGDADDLFDLPEGIGGDGGGGGIAKAATVYRSYRLGRDADPGASKPSAPRGASPPIRPGSSRTSTKATLSWSTGWRGPRRACPRRGPSSSASGSKESWAGAPSAASTWHDRRTWPTGPSP